MKVFTKKFTEYHITGGGHATSHDNVSNMINSYLKDNSSVELVSVHALFNTEPNLSTYSLSFLAVFKGEENG